MHKTAECLKKMRIIKLHAEEDRIMGTDSVATPGWLSPDASAFGRSLLRVGSHVAVPRVTASASPSASAGMSKRDKYGRLEEKSKGLGVCVVIKKGVPRWRIWPESHGWMYHERPLGR